jgi:hypothetical protein
VNPGEPAGERSVDPLWGQYLMNEIRGDYHDRVMTQLRIDAVGPDNVDKAGRIVLPEGIQSRIDDGLGGGAGAPDIPFDQDF